MLCLWMKLFVEVIDKALLGRGGGGSVSVGGIFKGVMMSVLC